MYLPGECYKSGNKISQKKFRKLKKLDEPNFSYASKKYTWGPATSGGKRLILSEFLIVGANKECFKWQDNLFTCNFN